MVDRKPGESRQVARARVRREQKAARRITKDGLVREYRDSFTMRMNSIRTMRAYGTRPKAPTLRT